MSMTFLDSVNRILRVKGIIRGDTDAVTTFSDLQHGATINLAIIAIQDTFTDLMAFYDFPLERTSSTITLLTGVRTYTLATDFVEFWMPNQTLYNSTTNGLLIEYPGGERALSTSVLDYKTATGAPSFWYHIEGATKSLGFYQVPDVNSNNQVLSYDYEKDVVPTLSTDVMPFQRDIETNTFCEMAAVRFSSLFSANPKEPNATVEDNPQYKNSRATLLKLVNPNKPDNFYGAAYPK